MNDAVYTVFMDLINLTVHMMPIFVYLGPKHRDRKSIAAISIYLWVIMISMEPISHISPQVFFMFRGILFCLYFLVSLVSFKRALLKRRFLYISAWLFMVPSTSLNEFAPWILKEHVSLIYGQICAAISPLWACGFYAFVRFRLRDRANRLFDQLSRQSCPLLPTYPSVSLFTLFVGDNTISPSRSLAVRGLEDVLFYLALYVMVLVLYVLVLSSILEIMCRRRAGGELQFAGQLTS